ncbi:hypothetical protein Lesp02_32660, partial [Lentzea sp. NBRC 105346]
RDTRRRRPETDGHVVQVIRRCARNPSPCTATPRTRAPSTSAAPSSTPSWSSRS